MGREVRRVPADWQHPKDKYTGKYEPLLDGDYAAAAREWDDERAKWERGEFPDYASEESKALPYDQWNGRRPFSEDYMPRWTPDQATHLMMYETTSEGTPISPAFATPEELARWLADNGASAFGSSTASYEAWLRVAQGGYAPSAVYTPEAGLQSGVAALSAYPLKETQMDSSKKTAHTPGPWKVAEHSWCETSVYAGDRTIACLDINDATEETQEALEAQMAADARLIVAAPDLLAALRPFANYACNPPCGCHNCAARAAVVKATGALASSPEQK